MPPDVGTFPVYVEDTGSRHQGIYAIPKRVPPERVVHDVRTFPLYPEDVNQKIREEQRNSREKKKRGR